MDSITDLRWQKEKDQWTWWHLGRNYSVWKTERENIENKWTKTQSPQLKQ